MAFRTEKDIEAELESETRSITMPDGSRREFTAQKCVWRRHDYITAWGHHSAERIVELAVIDSIATNRPFDFNYPFVVGYMYNAYIKRHGARRPPGRYT